MQQNLDLGRAGFAQPLAIKPRGNNLGIIDQKRVSRFQIVRQVSDQTMFRLSVRRISKQLLSRTCIPITPWVAPI